MRKKDKKWLFIKTFIKYFSFFLLLPFIWSCTDDIFLTNLSISHGSLTPVFSADVTAYSVEVPMEVSEITLTPTAADSNLVIKVNGISVVSGSPTETLKLCKGYNSIIIEVEKEDGSIGKKYTIVVCRLTESSHNANMVSLSISHGILTPAFSSDTTAYSVEVPIEVAAITMSPTVAGVNAAVTVNGIPVASGNPTDEIFLKEGPNSIMVEVQAEDGIARRMYYITANRFLNQGYAAFIAQSSNIPDGDVVFVGENTSSQKIKALRPLVDEIFATYGFPSTNIGKARAIRDFVARYAIHPFAPFHRKTISNMAVLPEGKTWEDFLAAYSTQSSVNSIYAYWSPISTNGFDMINALFGSINLETLQRDNDGMLLKIDTGRYRIKDFNSYYPVYCTWQDYIYISLLASAGLHGMQLRTNGHDPAAVYIPEWGKWIYEDPTFNEEYILDGNGMPLSPVELLFYSAGEGFHRLIPVKDILPDWDSNIYINNLEDVMCSYTSTMNAGFSVMGSQLRNNITDNLSWNMLQVQIAINGLAATIPFGTYLHVSRREAFPDLGVSIEKMYQIENGYRVFLKSSFPNHKKFMKKVNDESWQDCNDIDLLPLKDSVVVYRSLDAENFYGKDAIIAIVKKN